MKVLHILNTDERRGAQLFASDLTGSLAGNGLAQLVVVLRPGSDPVDFEVPVRAAASRVPPIPGLRVQVPVLGHLRSITSEWRPDVIQTHGGEAHKNAVLAGLSRKTPIIYRRIGSAPRSITQGPRRLAYRELMRRAARIVAVADSVRRKTIEIFGVDDRVIVTIPNGVDPSRLETLAGRDETRDELGLDGNARVVVWVGAMTWEKNPLGAIDVLTRVAAGDPDALAVMVGDGPLRNRVADQIEARGLRGKVRLLGRRADLPEIIGASDVALVTSSAEGMPASVIEAGMLGLPVAAYAVAGLPEVVEDGATGCLAPAGDVDVLARSVSALLSDEGLRITLGNEARKRCLSSFSIGGIADRYRGLYAEVAR